MVDIIKVLNDYQMNVTIYDPVVPAIAVQKEYGLICCNELPGGKAFDGIIVAVNHRIFETIDYRLVLKPESVIFDVKGVLKSRIADGRL